VVAAHAFDEGRKSRSWIVIVAVLISICSAAIGAATRDPWPDEGSFSSAAYNLAHHGFMGTTVLDSPGNGLTRIGQRTYWIMPLFVLGETLWYRIFPATLFWARAFSILWLPLLIAAYLHFLEKLAPHSRIPSVAACLLCFNFFFIDSADFARPDFMCAALGLCGFAAYMSWRENHLERALLAANACIAVSGLTHPNGVFYFVGLLVLVLWFDRGRIGFRGVCAAVLPYLVVAGAWGIYAAQDPGAFADQLRVNGTNGRWPGTWNPMKILWAEIRQRYLKAFGIDVGGLSLLKFATPLAWMTAIAVCCSTPRLLERSSIRLLLTMVTVCFAAMSVFNQKLSTYLIHILPLYIALLAVAIDWLWERWPRWRPAVVVAVAGLIALDTGGIWLKAFTRTHAATEKAMFDYLGTQLRPSDRVAGSSCLIYRFGFDPRLVDDPYLGIRSGRVPDVIIVEPFYDLMYTAWRRERTEDMKRIDGALAASRPAWSQGGYKVFFRRDR
jgi:hypothetical protein